MRPLPYLLPWVRVLLLIRSITSTTWGHEAWPEAKPVIVGGEANAPTPWRAVQRAGWGAIQDAERFF